VRHFAKLAAIGEQAMWGGAMASGFTGALRTRADVWGLSHQQTWHPTLLWYAKAIGALHKNPGTSGITNPTWWRYQAAIHDYDDGADPYAVNGEPMPSAADQNAFWRACQHGGWFFLPWHRIYLYYFEEIIATTVVSLGGPPDWALPYWDYSNTGNPDALVLPPAFREAKLPNGSDNPLRVDARAPGVNAGHKINSRYVSLNCLKQTHFGQAAVSGTTGFGGGPVIHHDPGQLAGALENVPHGAVHNAVGGPSGWMSAFNTAPLDPIFWVHHANIDRLWQVWLGLKATNTDPPDASWLDAIGAQFRFHDSAGAVGMLTKPRQVLDSAQALQYKYESLADPLPPGLQAPVPKPQEAVAAAMVIPTHPAEMVGASDSATPLGNAPAAAEFDIGEPTGPAKLAAAAAEAPQRHVYLRLENIRAQRRTPSYAVYLNVPDGAELDAYEDNYAGLISMFGVAESSRTTAEHGGDGLTYVLDITDVVQQLSQKGDWNPKHVRVTLAPLDAYEAESAATVGRISLYYH
jgi:tyrosinase